MTPTLNMNLMSCGCSDTRRRHCRASSDAIHQCPTLPVLIPCPLPRSVTFTVRLGECSCNPGVIGRDHTPNCPARPIRVTCSISGETWEGSEVNDVEVYPRETLAMVSIYDMPRIATACRERWEIVKAVLLNTTHACAAPAALVSQRDAIFATLAEKVRVEQEDDATTRDLVRLIPELRAPDIARATAEDYLSAKALARYVSHLIITVGALP